MNDLRCTEARDLAPEFALGILPREQRSLVAAHILRCPECRNEVEEFGQLGEDLLELIPSAEPPLGFDRRVLEATPPQKHRFGTRILAGVGAAAAAAALAIGLTLAQSSSGPREMRASLVENGHVVGSVYTEGRPRWLWMTVRNGPESGHVTCQLVQADGHVLDVGSFDLVGGSGYWAAPEPPGVGPISGARLVAANGHIVAQATFK
jgi:predicted anti-sigma-YlaC factor YlaD